MEVTLIRQGKSSKETEAGKEYEFLQSGEITPISKSALRLAYACGKRPLYVNNGGEDWDISLESKPHHSPDRILCGPSSSSSKSACILQRQLYHLGLSVGVTKLNSLSESALSKGHLKYFYTNLIQNSFNSLAKKGLKHIVVVAEPKELEAISYALTGKENPLKDGVSMQMIRDGKVVCNFEPENPTYITEGIYETMLNHHINGENCPKHLEKFKGKIRNLIGDGYLSGKFRSQLNHTK